MRVGRVIDWRWAMLSAGTTTLRLARNEVAEEQAGEGALTVLRTAEQVHLLTREAAGRGHPAVIRGVVTCSLPDSEAIVIQDSTRGIYVDQFTQALGDMPK